MWLAKPIADLASNASHPTMVARMNSPVLSSASVPIPKFASFFGTLATSESKDSSHLLI